MSDNDDSTDASKSSAADVTRGFLNAIAPGSGDEFLDEIEARFGAENLDDAILAGVAAGEQITALRRRSRGMSSYVAAGARGQSGDEPGATVHSRSVEGPNGEYVGVRVWISDPHVDVYAGDEEVLIRDGTSEFVIPVPRGVGEIEDDVNDSVRELLIRPPGFDPDPLANLKPQEEAADRTECRACYHVEQMDVPETRCIVHSKHGLRIPKEDADDDAGDDAGDDGDRLSDSDTSDIKPAGGDDGDGAE